MSTTATKAPEPRPSARDRLLSAANELFYSEGVQSVGIDRIIERAGVAKASLYNLFGSKEELVGAYLESRHERMAARMTAAIAQAHSPREQILAVFDAQARQYELEGFNGCPFVAASTEAPQDGVAVHAADRFRAFMQATFTDLAAQAGAPDAAGLGRQLHLIYDGAGIAGRMDHHDVAIGPAARAVVEATLDAALGAGS